MLWHFGNSFNLTRTYNWDYDADTKEMISDLTKLKEESGKEKIKLGITWLFEPTVNFYRVTKKLDWLEKVDREGIEGKYDYYYVGNEDRNKVNGMNKKLIKAYPISASMLME